jgi:uncharacterized protein (DUF427 family)
MSMPRTHPNPAPGFRNIPRSHIATRPVAVRVRVTLNGEVLADSREAIEMREGSYAPVYYLPRKDVRMARFERSAHSTHCPYKGDAAHFSIVDGPQNVAWSYERPYDEMLEIRDRIGFYPKRVDAIAVSND